MKDLLSLLRSAIRGSEKEFTSGSIPRAILMLSVPVFLGMVMGQLISVVDMLFVARLGAGPVSTVALTELVFVLVYSIAFGLNVATSAIVSRRIGEKDLEAAAATTVQAIWVVICIGVPFSVGGVLLAPQILALVGATPEMIVEGIGFMRITMGTIGLSMILFLFGAILRGAGDTSLEMKALLFCNIVNVVLDPCFIFGLGPFPEWGIAGAAVATALGMLVGVSYQLYHLVYGSCLIKLRRRHLVILGGDVVGKIIKVARGGIGDRLLQSSIKIIIVRIIFLSGKEALAGYIIAHRIISLIFVPAWGISRAAGILVGQNLGARRPERAEKSVRLAGIYMLVLMTMISVILLVFSGPIVSLFTNEQRIVHNAVLNLRILCMGGFIMFGIAIVVNAGFNGAGKTSTPAVLTLVSFGAVQLPVAYVLSVSLEMGATGAFIAMLVADVCYGVGAILMFRKGHWRTVNL